MSKISYQEGSANRAPSPARPPYPSPLVDPVEKPLAVVTDPLARTIARARKGNAVDRLAKLLEEESRWKRKQTIASNKLADVRSRLNQFAIEVAQQFAVDIAVAARKPGEKGEDK